MDADWYEDPLGRFDGRFFDGESWTSQISVGGALKIDPDFVPPRTPVGFEAEVEAPAVAPVNTAVVRGADELPAAAAGGSRSSGRRRRRVSELPESPVRVVATLDEFVARPGAIGSPSAPSRVMRWLIGLGLLAVVGVLIAVSVRGRTDSTQPDLGDLTEEQAARVEDLEGSSFGDMSTDELQELGVDVAEDLQPVPGNETFGASETIRVGSFDVLNGAPLLEDMAAWHRDDAQGRGIELDDDAACWFGELGDAAEQNVHCGPIVDASAAGLVFDSIPVVFQPISESGESVLALPLFGDVAIRTALPNLLTLVGPDDQVGPDRGERGEG